MKRLTCIFFFLGILTMGYAITPQQLADSLNMRTGFTLGCIPKVKVNKLKVKGDYIWVYTNKTLSGVIFSSQEITHLRWQISQWVRGDGKGKVSIYSDDIELGDLLPHRLHARRLIDLYPIPNSIQMGKSLQGQRIALWPSHGLYYHSEEDRFKPQRATMWSTVEDVYTIEYAELVSQYLERAGAEVLWPRARYGKDSAASSIGVSGYPRWVEGARYWLEYIGVPDSIWQTDTIHKDYIDDLRCRGNWVNWLHQQQPITLSIALHTDGYSQPGDSITIGTLAIYSPEGQAHQSTFKNQKNRILNRDLADYVQTQVVEDIRAKYDSTWTRRQLLAAGYCEAKYPDIPSVLLEILSHKQMADMQLGLNPAFRNHVARAIYKGIGEWIHAQTGTPFVVQPLPVQHMRIIPTNHNIWQLRWKATEDTLATAQAEYFIIQYRENNGEWQHLAQTKETVYDFTPKATIKYDFRVIAGNKGGTSDYSEILSAYLAANHCEQSPWALIVNDFYLVDGPQWFQDSTYAGIVPGSYSIPDKEDGIYIGDQFEYNRALDWRSDDDCGWGMCYRNHLGSRQVGNTHDYAARHGSILAQLGISYVSTSSMAIDTIESIYTMIDYVLGKEQHALPNWMQTYCDNGGKALISGAYLGTIHHASQAGCVMMDTMRFTYPTHPNANRMCAADCTAFEPNHSQAVLARYADTGTPSIVQSKNTILCAIPMDSFDQFEWILMQLYEKIITYSRTN